MTKTFINLIGSFRINFPPKMLENAIISVEIALQSCPLPWLQRAKPSRRNIFHRKWEIFEKRIFRNLLVWHQLFCHQLFMMINWFCWINSMRWIHRFPEISRTTLEKKNNNWTKYQINLDHMKCERSWLLSQWNEELNCFAIVTLQNRRRKLGYAVQRCMLCDPRIWMQEREKTIRSERELLSGYFVICYQSWTKLMFASNVTLNCPVNISISLVLLTLWICVLNMYGTSTLSWSHPLHVVKSILILPYIKKSIQRLDCVKLNEMNYILSEFN